MHTRPVEQGSPAKIWALTCTSCEDFLRHDDLWASTLSKIPETHDEAATREEREKSHIKQQQDISTRALAVLAARAERDDVFARADAPQALCPNGHQNPATARFCVDCGAPVARPQAVTCPDGHESPAGARFCVDCGQRTGVLNGAPRVPEAAAEAALAEQVPQPPAAPAAELPAPPAPPKPVRRQLPSNTKMRGMKREQLAELAAEAGIPAGGTRQQVLDRLIAASNSA